MYTALAGKLLGTFTHSAPLQATVEQRVDAVKAGHGIVVHTIVSDALVSITLCPAEDMHGT
jgi:hypothetical protein